MALSPQHALIYLMITVSAADREMTDRELRRIGTLCRAMPIFQMIAPEVVAPIMAEAMAQLGPGGEGGEGGEGEEGSDDGGKKPPKKGE